jgi:endonuclease/exonuclease/phosphatase family metal-dependent hydrolase
MPSITDRPPPDIRGELADLRDALDAGIPTKALDRNLLIATWNIRAFGNLTEKWVAEEHDSPKRDLGSLLCIAEIVSRFDVVAIQEARANLTCLREMLRWLGPQWGMILTDVTRGAPGNGERMAFVFDRRKLDISGLACELVVPKEQLDGAISADALQRQFARTPYAVSFRSGAHAFVLVTLHVLYGANAAERVPELRAIATWLSDWAQDLNAWDRNLIALGDFNIDRFEDDLYQAFTSTGLTTPRELDQVPRTIFSDPDKPNLAKFYDQIAWFTGEQGIPALSLTYLRSGSFDFVDRVLVGRHYSKTQLSWRISDHYPLWAEFLTRSWD